jgi:hypothetical protein
MDAPPAATCSSQAHRARPHHRPQAPRTPSQGAGAADENHHPFPLMNTYLRKLHRFRRFFLPWYPRLVFHAKIFRSVRNFKKAFKRKIQ